MKAKPLISIIVPVYNVMPYIIECLDSIECQTFKDFEVILIDDGSTDESGEICDNYSLKDKRIKVIHQENKGVANARNTGLDNALADLIMFIDPDDYVDKDFCRVPYELILKHNSDIVCFNYRIIKNDGISKTKELNIPAGFISSTQYIKMLYENNSYYLFNKIYKKALFEKIRFPEGYAYEDVFTLNEIVDNSKIIYSSKDALYNYRIYREGNIIGMKSYDKICDYLEAYKTVYEDLAKKTSHMTSAVINYFMHCVV